MITFVVCVFDCLLNSTDGSVDGKADGRYDVMCFTLKLGLFLPEHFILTKVNPLLITVTRRSCLDPLIPSFCESTAYTTTKYASFNDTLRAKLPKMQSKA